MSRHDGNDNSRGKNDRPNERQMDAEIRRRTKDTEIVALALDQRFVGKFLT